MTGVQTCALPICFPVTIDEGDNWIWDGVNKGKAYKGTEVDNQLPWEYDAYSKEIELSRKFVKKFYSNW